MTSSTSIDHELKYFAKAEFACQYTGENKITDALLLKLDELREQCGFPFIITSGYRSLAHPVERAKKTNTGTHTQGIAADIKVRDGVQRFTLVKEAIKLGFTGVGVANTFVHVDIRALDTNESPVMWCY